MTDKEVFALGEACGYFGTGALDAGIHCILPVTEVATGTSINDVFEPLVETLTNIAQANPNSDDLGTLFINECVTWAATKGLVLR